MFSGLREEIEGKDNRAQVSAGRRWLFYAGVFLASAIAFGGPYLGIRFLE